MNSYQLRLLLTDYPVTFIIRIPFRGFILIESGRLRQSLHASQVVFYISRLFLKLPVTDYGNAVIYSVTPTFYQDVHFFKIPMFHTNQKRPATTEFIYSLNCLFITQQIPLSFLKLKATDYGKVI